MHNTTETGSITQEFVFNGSSNHDSSTDFLPHAPASLVDSGLTRGQAEALLLKRLLQGGATSGRELADQIALPFALVTELLQQTKMERLVVLKSAALMGDYVYDLTEAGLTRASGYMSHSTYCGAAPVPLDDYIASVALQSVTSQQPKIDDVRRAIGDLMVGDEMLDQLGAALNSGMGFFLFGDPGNGKTSIAERVTESFGSTIWIPRAILAGTEIIQLFDASCHELAEPEYDELGLERHQIDHRWVRIKRPTIVVGGELTMDQLEVRPDPVTGVCEAPLQLKSNGGTLVIDDFGRQRISIEELLNRWVMPLEKRFDMLSTPAGRKFKVPFDQLLAFATNLDPRELVEEAFLRRVPFKIHVADPTEAEFRALFADVAAANSIAVEPGAVDWLLEHHYRNADRSPRFCHPRDLLHQVKTL
ncbi:MAG: AAA family ATPase, partial [Pirellulales bacterium]|nr:AAA family ATPase [Pirellulales bacterium]